MPNPVNIRELVPLLMVSDLKHSLTFYIDKLGFQLCQQADDKGNLIWCRIEKDGVAVMLQQACLDEDDMSKVGNGVTLYWICDDVDTLQSQFAANGLELNDPTVAYYGMKQLYLKDPDGYDLCFESPVQCD
ncbi:MAG TPA: bleomycin resistance protein [Phycisphaerales bacterium]|nr:bleomycin resistance protein [Phycisphaerales bacterium]HCD32094.1 bleomycin resistance protein [Phycisphaerales bacterium]|tara:strand:+ start:597 stop:989 length:393 start_codon:yes stop_codon:yes gene_type:complete